MQLWLDSGPKSSFGVFLPLDGMCRALLNLNPSLHKLNLSYMQNKFVSFALLLLFDRLIQIEHRKPLAHNPVIYVVRSDVGLIEIIKGRNG